MSYMTSDWRKVKNDAIAGLDRDFVRLLRGYARPVQIAYVRIMAACQGNPAGVELRHKDRDCWAFVLSNVSGPEPWRSQYFDAFAFSRHACYGTMEEAIEAIIGEGYWIIDPGALDRMAQGSEWQRGLSWIEQVREMSAPSRVTQGGAS